MAQETFGDWDVTSSNNVSITGDGAAVNIDEGCAPGNVNDALRAIMSACILAYGDFPRGTARPSYLTAGKLWLNTTTAAAPVLTYYDGTDNITVMTFNHAANTITLSASVTVPGALANIVEDLSPQLGAALDVNGFSITSASNADVTISPNGTGDVVLDADDVFFEEDLVHTGDTDNKITFGTDTQTFQTGGSSRLDISDSGVRLGAANARVTTILDEDAMGSDSATALATQQSIKAYVDANAGGWTEGTATATTSGTTSTFSSLPTGIKEIVISLSAVSTDGVEELMIQIGDSGGVETTGYVSKSSNDSSQDSETTGFILTVATAATDAVSGVLTLKLLDSSDNTWVLGGQLRQGSGNPGISWCAGTKALSAVLDRVVLTSTGTPDTFDGGKWNISYRT